MDEVKKQRGIAKLQFTRALNEIKRDLLVEDDSLPIITVEGHRSILLNKWQIVQDRHNGYVLSLVENPSTELLDTEETWIDELAVKLREIKIAADKYIIKRKREIVTVETNQAGSNNSTEETTDETVDTLPQDTQATLVAEQHIQAENIVQEKPPEEVTNGTTTMLQTNPKPITATHGTEQQTSQIQQPIQQERVFVTATVEQHFGLEPQNLQAGLPAEQSSWIEQQKQRDDQQMQNLQPQNRQQQQQDPQMQSREPQIRQQQQEQQKERNIEQHKQWKYQQQQLMQQEPHCNQNQPQQQQPQQPTHEQRCNQQKQQHRQLTKQEQQHSQQNQQQPQLRQLTQQEHQCNQQLVQQQFKNLEQQIHRNQQSYKQYVQEHQLPQQRQQQR